MPTRVLLILLPVLLGGFGVNLEAQRAPAPQPPVIQTIEIEYQGARNVSRQVILANIDVRPGMPLYQRNLDRSIRSLEKTGLFENIFIETIQIDKKTVKLLFQVEPKHRISAIRFIGQNIKPKRLQKKITSQVDDVLDEILIKQDRNTLWEYYQNKGYTQATVEYDILRESSTGLSRVVFYIDKAERYAVGKIQFQGNASISSRKLRKQMDTKRWLPLLSWITGGGRFKEEIFQNDIQALRDSYKEHGFLDIQISEDAITVDTQGGKINVTIPITEGRQYAMGEVFFSGNTLFTNSDLAALLQLKPGDTFSSAQIKKDTQALSDHYGKDGYLDTRVLAQRKPNLQTGNIDIQYTIKEGDQNYIESINIIGNKKTKSTVILRELALAPGEVFDTVKMHNSEARLRNTRYFEEVNLSPESTALPSRKDLRIELKEGRTGNLTFGAGFSSLDKGVLFLELTQGNFDLFNPRSLFQGDGQKFRLRFQIGSSSNEILLSFEEPWFLERQLALGFELFRIDTDYLSSEYNELRTGLEVYLRKRLWGLWTSRLAYRLEGIDIFDIDKEEAPPDVLEEEGQRSVSKISASLSRDTRNSFLLTTRGNRISFISELAGLGAETEYLRLEARGAQYFALFNEDTHVISAIGRMGTLIEYADDRVPFFDRFYLGGPNSLRGFEFREVGPKQSAANGNFEPVGGNAFGFFSLEYNYKLVEPLRLALFYDAGYVNSDENDFSVDDYNDNWGFGVRIMIFGSPLRLDYGIPITTDKYNKDDGNQFYFSFGARF